MNDKAYFKGIKNHDWKTESKFYQSNWPMVKDLVFKLDTYGQLHAQDIYQEAVAIVFHKIQNDKLVLSEMTAGLSTYLYSIARNICFNTLKKVSITYSQDLLPDLTEEQVEDNYHREVMVVEVVKKVKSPCNEMLLDRYIHKMTYDEIAVKYNYSNYNSAKKKNGECLKKARKLIMETPMFHAQLIDHA